MKSKKHNVFSLQILRARNFISSSTLEGNSKFRKRRRRRRKKAAVQEQHQTERTMDVTLRE